MSEHILHPELFEQIPLTGKMIMRAIERRASEMAAMSLAPQDITVAVRTLNEASSLEGLLEDIDRQQTSGEVEVVVVDNDSSDRTPEVARYYGATVVSLARRDFTYPRSMNLAMDAASHNAVFLTVGHARLSNNQLLNAGGRNLVSNRGESGGAFGHTLPNANASIYERIQPAVNLAFRKPTHVKRAGLGVMGATSAVLDKQVWRKMGRFDECYESGGEDTALAAKILDAGMVIEDDPILSVHHSHGLGFINTIKQWQHWLETVKGPIKLDLDKLVARRPDLDVS